MLGTKWCLRLGFNPNHHLSWKLARFNLTTFFRFRGLFCFGGLANWCSLLDWRYILIPRGLVLLLHGFKYFPCVFLFRHESSSGCGILPWAWCIQNRFDKPLIFFLWRKKGLVSIRIQMQVGNMSKFWKYSLAQIENPFDSWKHHGICRACLNRKVD